MWTESNVATLRKGWREGLSASQIAKQIGGFSRNAVIGKVHRLGLAGRARPARKVQRRTRAVNHNLVRGAKIAAEKPAPIAAPIPVEPLNIPFLDRETYQCRAVTDSTRYAQKVCGHPIEGTGVYCRWHHAIHNVAPDPKKKPRAR